MWACSVRGLLLVAVAMLLCSTTAYAQGERDPRLTDVLSLANGLTIDSEELCPWIM